MICPLLLIPKAAVLAAPGILMVVKLPPVSKKPCATFKASRRTGWSARAGLWRCPAIPWEFVALYPPLRHLSDDLDPACRSMPWHPKRAVFHRLGPADPLSTLGHQLLGLLRSAPDGGLTRRQLQQRVSRPFPRACLTTASANSGMRALSPPPPMDGCTHSTRFNSPHATGVSESTI